MTIHILVEGPSERAFLDAWARRLVKGDVVKVHPHQGKGTLPEDLLSIPPRNRRGLLDQLPAKLRAFDRSLDADTDRVVVLLDADADDPEALRESLLRAVEELACGIAVDVYVAVEETEAFYLGDQAAVLRAFPQANQKLLRDYVPDSIVGTWELFGRIIGDGGENKVAWGEAMGPLVTVSASKNRSPSFRAFRNGLATPGKVARKQPRRRAYRHPPRKKSDPSRRR